MLFPELFSVKQVNYQDMFLFNEKQAKLK